LLLVESQEGMIPPHHNLLYTNTADGCTLNMGIEGRGRVSGWMKPVWRIMRGEPGYYKYVKGGTVGIGPKSRPRYKYSMDLEGRGKAVTQPWQ
jgi:hypothetical protein